MKKIRGENMWDIFDEMRRMQEEMDRMFAQLFGYRRLLEQKGKKSMKDIVRYRSPVTDVYETENSVIAAIELPGVDKKDIELNITDNALEVKVEKKAEKEIKKKGIYGYSAASKSFYKMVTFPVEVDSEKAKAEYKNGVLRVEIPKKGKIKERKRRLKIE